MVRLIFRLAKHRLKVCRLDRVHSGGEFGANRVVALVAFVVGELPAQPVVSVGGECLVRGAAEGVDLLASGQLGG